MSNIEKKREDKRKIFKTINSANWTNKITFLQTTKFCIRPRQSFRFQCHGLEKTRYFWGKPGGVSCLKIKIKYL